MADEVEKIRILIEAQDKRFQAQMERNARTVRSQTARMARDTKAATTAMDKDMSAFAAKSAGVLATFGKGLVIGAIGATISGISSNVRGVVADLSNMAKEADRVGVSLDWFQALERGFGQAGVKATEFTAAMTTFTARVGDAAEGSGQLHAALSRAGIQLRDAQGNLRPTIDLLRAYAGVIGNARSEAERMALVEDAFGRGGRSLANALKGGQDALDGFMRAAQDGGFIIEENLIRKAEVLDDKWDDLTRRIGVATKSMIIAGAVNLGVLTDVDKIFGGEAVARGQLGDELYDALIRNAAAAEEAAPAIEALKYDIDDLGRTVAFVANDIGNEVSALIDVGALTEALGLADVAAEMEALVSEIASGQKPAEEFKDELAALIAEAKDALAAASAIDGVDMTNAIASVDRLSTAMSRLFDYAAAAANKVREVAGLGAVVPGPKYGADAEDPLNLVWTPTGMPGGRPRAAPSELGFEPVGRGGGGGKRGGGGKGKGGRDEFAAAMDQTRERIEALQRESEVLLSVVAGNENYADALEFARKKSELLTAAQKAGKQITPDLVAEIDALAESYMTAGLAAEEAAAKIDGIREATETGIDAFTDLFDTIFIKGGSAKQALAGLLAQMARVQFQNAMLGLSGGGGGGIFSFLGGLLTPKRARGGPVMAGAAYQVNEHKPGSELFVPSQSGAVLTVPQAQAALRGQQSGPAQVALTVYADPSVIIQHATGAALNVVQGAVPGMIGASMSQARERGLFR